MLQVAPRNSAVGLEFSSSNTAPMVKKLAGPQAPVDAMRNEFIRTGRPEKLSPDRWGN